MYGDFDEVFVVFKFNVVFINIYFEMYVEYVEKSLNVNVYVFLEKLIVLMVEEGQRLVDFVLFKNWKMVIGYILCVYFVWVKFIEIVQDLGKFLVMCMNLNQQSSGDNWFIYKQLMKFMFLIVDCGVYYVDVMCMMIGVQLICVSVIGVWLMDEVVFDMYNYG